MKRIVMLAAALVVAAFTVALPSAANAAPTKVVICPSYAGSEFGGTDKVDTSGDPKSVTVTAPDGYLIGGYCVKGGLQTDFVTLDPPQETVTITVSNGKAVSHYSVWYVPDEDCPPYGS